MNHHRPKDSEMLDPDVRFLLANERTLLAWVRTGLTLQAGGFAIAHFAGSTTAGKLSGIVAMVSGGILAIIGYNRFRSADRAIRNHKLPQTGKIPALEVTTVVAIALLLAAMQLIDLIKK